MDRKECLDSSKILAQVLIVCTFQEADQGIYCFAFWGWQSLYRVWPLEISGRYPPSLLWYCIPFVATIQVVFGS